MVIVAHGPLFEYELLSAKLPAIGLTCRLSAADLRCDSYGIRLSMNPVPSEKGTSFSGFLIFMCSAWKFPSIMKPLIKRILLKVIGRQLLGTNVYRHTCFHTPSNFQGGLFQVAHTMHRIWPLIPASVLHFSHTQNQISYGKSALSTVG
jgi:hypothetical protein